MVPKVAYVVVLIGLYIAAKIEIGEEVVPVPETKEKQASEVTPVQPEAVTAQAASAFIETEVNRTWTQAPHNSQKERNKNLLKVAMTEVQAPMPDTREAIKNWLDGVNLALIKERLALIKDVFNEQDASINFENVISKINTISEEEEETFKSFIDRMKEKQERPLEDVQQNVQCEAYRGWWPHFDITTMAGNQQAIKTQLIPENLQLVNEHPYPKSNAAEQLKHEQQAAIEFVCNLPDCDVLVDMFFKIKEVLKLMTTKLQDDPFGFRSETSPANVDNKSDDETIHIYANEGITKMFKVNKKELDFGYFVRIMVSATNYKGCRPMSHGAGWIGPRTPSASGDKLCRTQVQESMGDGEEPPWFERLRELYYNPKIATHRELITFLYKLPTSLEFKKLMDQLVKVVPSPGVNTKYVKAMYAILQQDLFGRKLAGSKHDHFFFLPIAWSAFNLQNAWFPGRAYGPTRIQGDSDQPFRPIFIHSSDELSTREEAALREEADGNEIQEIEGGKSVSYLEIPHIDWVPANYKTPPAMEFLEESGWLRRQGPSGTTVDLMSLWYALNEDMEPPVVSQIEKVKILSDRTPCGGTSLGDLDEFKNYTENVAPVGAIKLFKALLGFYMQNNIHSAIEVIVGAAPYFLGTHMDIRGLQNGDKSVKAWLDNGIATAVAAAAEGSKSNNSSKNIKE